MRVIQNNRISVSSRVFPVGKEVNSTLKKNGGHKEDTGKREREPFPHLKKTAALFEKCQTRTLLVKECVSLVLIQFIYQDHIRSWPVKGASAFLLEKEKIYTI